MIIEKLRMYTTYSVENHLKEIYSVFGPPLQAKSLVIAVD